MAKNYSFKEVVEVIAKGNQDIETFDIFNRYQVVGPLVKAALAGSKEATLELLTAMPEGLTAGKVNKDLKIAYGVYNRDEDAAEEKEEKPEEKKTRGRRKKEDAPADEYSGMSEVELYKECKKRGLKAAARKDAKYYIDLLKKDDKLKDKKDADDGDDDWGEEEEKPAKKKAPAKKAPAKKAPAKEDPDDDDDDDDWDI